MNKVEAILEVQDLTSDFREELYANYTNSDVTWATLQFTALVTYSNSQISKDIIDRKTAISGATLPQMKSFLTNTLDKIVNDNLALDRLEMDAIIAINSTDDLDTINSILEEFGGTDVGS
jgi:hypothetical protein